MEGNSLFDFLKKNEYLFTILGVFLILAFIFNTPQLINIVNQHSSSTNIAITQLQCSINETEVSLFNGTFNGTKPVTQINCTGNVITDLQSGNNSDPFIKSSTTFTFLCLLIALFVYFAICLNLIQALRECIRKKTSILKTCQTFMKYFKIVRFLSLFHLF